MSSFSEIHKKITNFLNAIDEVCGDFNPTEDPFDSLYEAGFISYSNGNCMLYISNDNMQTELEFTGYIGNKNIYEETYPTDNKYPYDDNFKCFLKGLFQKFPSK